jgi:type VI secretion system secreted protein Hcp
MFERFPKQPVENRIMAVDMYMKIDEAKGESKADGHKDEIDVLAWSWGESNSGSFHIGGGGGAGKVNMQDFSFTKYVDKASPNLLLFCANGKHLAKAELVCRKAGEKALEYLKITLTEVLVSSYSTGGSGGEDRLTENVSLNYAKIEFEYTEQDDKGGKGKAIKVGWDMQEQKKA